MADEKATKKQRILELAARMRLKRASGRELRSVQAAIARQYGAQNRPSLAYIASILEKAGIGVQSAITPAAAMPEPYATRLKDVLHFSTLAAAEDSLAALDRLYHEFRQAGDHEGQKWARALALQGKWRARAQAANPNVAAEKRSEKREIANWFQVWLETPELFPGWLAVRKQTEEFKRLAGEE
jgi:hypothetical protein